MATIAEQLAAAPVDLTLKSAAQPGGLTPLAWANTAGTWSEATGWSPPGFLASPPDGDRGGLFLNTESVTGGNGYTILKRNGSFGHIEERQFSTWLFIPTFAASFETEPWGYQCTAYQSGASDEYTFLLRAWEAGFEELLEEAEGVVMEATGSFAVAKMAGKVSMWVRQNAASPWTLVGAEVEEGTYSSGWSAFGGNGSNPKLIDFSTGQLSAEPKTVEGGVALSGTGALTGSGTRVRHGAAAAEGPTRAKFVDRAQALGAGLVYAPASAADPLANLGQLSLPQGQLAGGATLSASGLVPGAAAAQLDGSNDHIETEWEPFGSGILSFAFIGRRSSTGTEDALVSSAPGEDMILALSEVGDIHFTANAWSETTHWNVDEALGTSVFFCALVWEIGWGVRLYTAVPGGGLVSWGEQLNFGAPPEDRLLHIGHDGWAAFHGSMLPLAVFTDELSQAQLESLAAAGLLGASGLEGAGSLTAAGEVVEGATGRNKIYPDLPPRPTRYAAELQFSNNATRFFGPDEADAAGVPIRVQFDTEMPGGFGPGSISLPRVEGIESTAARLFVGVRVYDADSGRNLYEGRITSVSFGTDTIDLQTEGWAKHLEDDNTASMVFYDRDLSRWANGPGVSRQIALSAQYATSGASVESDVSAPALATQTPSTWSAAPSLPLAEGWYDAGPGNYIKHIDYAWAKSAQVGHLDANWVWAVAMNDDDVWTGGGTYSGSLRAAGPGSGTLTAAGAKERYGVVQFHYLAGPAGLANYEYKIRWTLLGVAGDHGITLRGSVAAPDQGRGVLGSDVAKYVVGRWAPLLSHTSGAGGSIEPTTFVIPHLAFYDNTNARAMIDALAVLGGSTSLPLDWGVYDRRTFFMKTPGSYGHVWRVRKDQASESANSGPDASARVNGVVVNYDDGTGKRLAVGPVGSGSDVETELLEDADPTNPANQDGARHWKEYDAGITSQEGATIIGMMVIRNANDIQWRGDIVVSGTIVDQSGARFPAPMMRAGDYAIVEDDADTRPRRIVNTSLSGDTVKASCGAPPDRLDVLLATNSVVLVGRV